MELVDLPVFGRQPRLVWREHRLVCVQAACPVPSRTVGEPAIDGPRLALIDRAGRCVTKVGRRRRTVKMSQLAVGFFGHEETPNALAAALSRRCRPE